MCMCTRVCMPAVWLLNACVIDRDGRAAAADRESEPRRPDPDLGLAIASIGVHMQLYVCKYLLLRVNI